MKFSPARVALTSYLSLDYLGTSDIPSRWLGLDVGMARCGLALSDPGGTLASPTGVVPTHPLATLPQRIALLLPAEGVLGVIAGLPLDPRGEEGASALSIRQLAEGIAKELNLPLQFQDERFTTLEVSRRRREAGRSSKQLRAEVDAFAAAAILQNWLDFRGRTNH